MITKPKELHPEIKIKFADANKLRVEEVENYNITKENSLVFMKPGGGAEQNSLPVANATDEDLDRFYRSLGSRWLRA